MPLKIFSEHVFLHLILSIDAEGNGMGEQGVPGRHAPIQLSIFRRGFPSVNDAIGYHSEFMMVSIFFIKLNFTQKKFWIYR